MSNNSSNTGDRGRNALSRLHSHISLRSGGPSIPSSPVVGGDSGSSAPMSRQTTNDSSRRSRSQHRRASIGSSSPANDSHRPWDLFTRFFNRLPGVAHSSEEDTNRRASRVQPPPAMSFEEVDGLRQFGERYRHLVQAGNCKPPDWPEYAESMANWAYNSLRNDPSQFADMSDEDFDKYVKKNPVNFWLRQLNRVGEGTVEILGEILSPLQLVAASEHAISRLPVRELEDSKEDFDCLICCDGIPPKTPVTYLHCDDDHAVSIVLFPWLALDIH